MTVSIKHAIGLVDFWITLKFFNCKIYNARWIVSWWPNHSHIDTAQLILSFQSIEIIWFRFRPLAYYEHYIVWFPLWLATPISFLSSCHCQGSTRPTIGNAPYRPRKYDFSKDSSFLGLKSDRGNNFVALSSPFSTNQI